jgi:3-oxoacyl-[acyl-carrier-protein] synthase II
MDTKKRVAVTGLGVISCIGTSKEEFWESITAGRSGIGPITLFDASRLPSKIGGEIKDFDPSKWFDAREARKMDRFGQFAVCASLDAFKDAGLTTATIDSERTSVILGNGTGGLAVMEEAMRKVFEKGPERIPPMALIKNLSSLGAANVAMMIQAKGPCQCICTACASATDAIGTALGIIRDGKADVVIAGGAEAALTLIGVASFCSIQALSTRNDDPQGASRPFDADRDGFVMAEGAGMLVLEDWDRAVGRGARIYCELVGYGASCDAHHLTAPDPEGNGAARAMALALSDAGLGIDDIDYINAHGTSTPLNDPIETAAIKKVFGERAKKLKVSSTKSMIGHAIGAAGGIEAVTTVLAIERGYYPPTINLRRPDPACDLDYVPNKGVSGVIRAALSNSLGFGGQNGVIAFKNTNEGK